MPVNALKPRLAQVGVIRLGELKTNPKTGKPFPAKLANFRITTPSKRIADDIAELLGGQPRPWRNGNTPEWEVYTNTSEMRVMVPPQTVDPNMEMWAPGMLTRLCDGDTERMRDIPCMCRAEFGNDFGKTAPKLKICKITFRVSLMIHDLKSAGTFKLEAHGWGSAANIPELVNTISQARRALPGTLTVIQRSKSILHPNKPKDEQVENRNWVEPRLDIDILTSGQMYSPELATFARQALGAATPDDQKAIGSTVAPASAARLEPAAGPAMTSDECIALIGAASSGDELDVLMARMRAAGVKDTAVVTAWMARATAFKVKNSAAAASKPEPPVSEVIDAEVVDDKQIDGKQAWQECLELAGERGWNVPTLAGKFLDWYEFDYRDDRATDAVLIEFLGLIKSGAVA